ncbi:MULTISPECIES: pitrilysin family protein [Lysinibacillus]|uniref:Insulinase family protein n=1 Tax=Lysinibacillus antri TaxID=2498145 RepID=A0A3S0P5T5_9BACI|nr:MULTISPECIES: pitrilysin family protein [Lysinibacillus]RUL55756.1 insulinase family protein [Lysinibacillus antri]TSI11360.1 insulinase family protein [Lysinibacillus sp. BW-2-10]
MVKIYTCQNGVRIVSEHIPHVRSISVGVWVGAGSRFELPEENGITHFIEHMLFKGTTTKTARQIAEEFDRIGGEINAFTSKENTCYYAKVLDHHGELAISILADMFFNSTFAKQELEKERQVVLEEILMSEDAPDDDVHEALWRVMYPNDALGLPILGTSQTLSTFNKETIEHYMEKHYYPENIVISVAGNITKELLQHIEKLFSKLERSPKVMETVLTYPTLSSGRIVKERDVEQSHIAISYPAVGTKDPNLYSFIALNNIIGGNMSSRLFQEVREERGLAYSIFSYQSCYQDIGAFTIYGSTNNQQLALLQKTIDDSLSKIQTQGITETELSNAKEQLKGSFVLGLESTNSRMSRNGRNELNAKRHKSIDETIADIDAVSMKKVDEMIDYILSAEPAISIIGQGVK